MSDPQLDSLADVRGLGSAYYDHKGELKYFSDATRLAILRAMGMDGEDTAALTRALAAEDPGSWNSLLPATLVLNPTDRRCVPLTLRDGGAAGAERDKQLTWTVELEHGGMQSGTTTISALIEGERRATFGGMLVKRELPLPPLPLGYHRLRVKIHPDVEQSSRLIVTPLQCYQPAAMVAGRRLWGITVQLYTLRTAENWGIGDFADLIELIRLSAPLGCALIGLNPLHALMPANPSHSSPYSPSSRYFLNVLYISLPLIPEFEACDNLRKRFAETEFQTEVDRLRSVPLVDYPAVAQLKLKALRDLHQHFRIEHLARDSIRAQAFRDFVTGQGEALWQHALFDSLDARLRAQDSAYWGWPVWPEQYRDVDSTAVRQYAKTHAADIEFYLYLQWLAAGQLDMARAAAHESGMALGLYGDLAVGANPGGSECWTNPQLYLQAASIGAPPDPLALLGQSWGLPPQDPRELQRQEYEPFIRLLRNAMRATAALRLDHVMALFRLWWVPRQFIATEGIYVHYPLHDLISILSLESTRNRCVIIGEDLGTVPDEMREGMQRHELLHYKVLLFERNPDGAFKAPQAYASRALATVTTHDLPTLRGWWGGLDLKLRDRLNLYPDTAMRTLLYAERGTERQQMMRALVAAGLWRWKEGEPIPPYSNALSRAIHLYLGSSRAALMTVQLEDLLGMTDPVNVPGTDKEHANWQRKLTAPATEIFARDPVLELLAALNKARAGIDPNR
jgi:4-alpha-glucanotransferase